MTFKVLWNLGHIQITGLPISWHFTAFMGKIEIIIRTYCKLILKFESFCVAQTHSKGSFIKQGYECPQLKHCIIPKNLVSAFGWIWSSCTKHQPSLWSLSRERDTIIETDNFNQRLIVNSKLLEVSLSCMNLSNRFTGVKTLKLHVYTSPQKLSWFVP